MDSMRTESSPFPSSLVRFGKGGVHPVFSAISRMMYSYLQAKKCGGWDSDHIRTHRSCCAWLRGHRMIVIGQASLVGQSGSPSSFLRVYTRLLWSALADDSNFTFPCRIKRPDDATGHPVWFPVPSFRWVLYASLGIMCPSGPPWWLDYRLDFILLGAAPSL